MRARSVIILLAAIVISFIGGYHFRSDTKMVKTEVVHDTIRDTVPVPILKTEIEIVPEPFPEFVTLAGDTVRDTIIVNIPRERKEYKTDAYRLRISGHYPELDYIEIYNKNVTRVIREKQKRVGFGVIGGYGIGKNGLSPYVGLGLYYRIW